MRHNWIGYSVKLAAMLLLTVGLVSCRSTRDRRAASRETSRPGSVADIFRPKETRAAPDPAVAERGVTALETVATTTTEEKNAPAQTGVARTRPAPEVVRWSFTYPTGQASSSLLLEKSAPGEIVVGQPFEYVIEVTNLTDAPLMDVVVTDKVSPSFQINRTDPKWEGFEERVAWWNIGQILGRDNRFIHVTAVATASGILSGCTDVHYRSQICSTIKAVEPRLEVTLSAPEEVLQCEEIPVECTVTNKGSGTAYGVSISNDLPPNLSFADSRGALDLGPLEAGRSKVVSAKLKAAARGEYAYSVTVKGEGLEVKSNALSLRVREPVLRLSCEGPSNGYLGEPAHFDIVATNTGDGVSRDTIIENEIPDGEKFIAATHFGTLEGGTVRWKLGDLAPEESREVGLPLRAMKRGFVYNSAVLRAECGVPSRAAAATRVKGIPAISVEVVDVSDPTHVGDHETYRITVSNQGSAVGSGIDITCALEDSMEYVASTGPTPVN